MANVCRVDESMPLETSVEYSSNRTSLVEPNAEQGFKALPTEDLGVDGIAAYGIGTWVACKNSI